MKLLIVNTPGRNITATIRSLARTSYDLEISIAYPKAPNKIDKKYTSKYVKNIHFIPDPLTRFKEFRQAVLALVKKQGYEFIMPFGFSTTVGLAQFKKQIEQAGATIPVPDFKTAMKAHDKSVCFNYAKKAGLAIPKTYIYNDLNDLLQQTIKYPIIIKGRRTSGIAKGLKIVKNEKELIKAHKEVEQLGKKGALQDFTRPIVQEYIDGDIYDACCFFTQGKMKSFVFQRRIRSLHNNLGGGIINETLNNKLKKPARDYAEKILQAISWEGSCQVELILDRKTKTFKLIEVNPKLWGTLELSIKAGVNFPLNMIRYYHYKEKIRPTPYKTMKFYWFFDLLFSKMIFKSDHNYWTIIKAFFKTNELDFLRDPRADWRNIAEGLQTIRNKKPQTNLN